MRRHELPGSDCNRADDDLTSLFDSFGLNQRVNTPTRGDNLLNVLATEDRVAVSGVAVDDVRLMSDHRMVYAKLRSRSPPCKSTSYTYRNIRRIDTSAFEDALQRSALFTAPASSTDAFANEMADIVSAQLEKVAPLHTARRRQPKSITSWLSPTAISAKRERYPLETLWKRSGAESDRITYRHPCRTANKIINQARRDHNSQHINSCTYSASRWAAVRELLHSSDNRRFTSDEENLKLCDSFSNFFSTSTRRSFQWHTSFYTNLRHTCRGKQTFSPNHPQWTTYQCPFSNPAIRCSRTSSHPWSTSPSAKDVFHPALKLLKSPLY